VLYMKRASHASAPRPMPFAGCKRTAAEGPGMETSCRQIWSNKVTQTARKRKFWAHLLRGCNMEREQKIQ
jgi:hypothetical protein